jgi:hypothetical protein
VIKRPTALVLGAGASAPFGFPSGRKLRDDIIRDLGAGSTDLYKVVATTGSDAKHITNFRDALQKSGQRSVDAFLERRNEFVGIGKVAIAAALIPYEKEWTLWGGDDNWYEYLFERLGPTLDDVKQSQLVVITFNYDRSFEHYFFSALRNTYNIGTDEAARILRDVLRVIHVHGQLGPLPYADHGQGNSRAYQPADISNLRDTAVAVAPAIKIVHEGATGDAEFVQARALLARSEMIIFLGFGYLPKNVERLGIASLSTNIGLTGTAVGLLEGERAAVAQLIGRHASLGNPHHGALEFLRTHSLLG